MNKRLTIPASVKRYLLAMYATAFQAGTHAVSIYCGVAGVHEAAMSVSETSFSVAPLSLSQMALVFFIAFGKSQLKYLDDHPLTELLPAATTISAPTPEAKPN